MQEGSQDSNITTQNETITSDIVMNGHTEDTPLLTAEETRQNDSSAAESPSNEATSPADPTPRGKKRKLAEVAALNRARALSPPWKKIEADSPTTIVVDGVRKSGRQNKELAAPLPSSKRTKRGAAPPREQAPKKPAAKTTPASQKATKSSEARNVKVEPPPRPVSRQTSEAGPSRKKTKLTGDIPPEFTGKSGARNRRKAEAAAAAAARAEALAASRAQITQAEPEPKRDGRRKRKASPPPVPPVAHPRTAEHPIPTLKPVKSLKINLRPPPPPILNPSNILPQRKHASIRELLLQDDPLEGEEETALTEEEARQEAETVKMLEDATKPGMYFDGDTWLEKLSLEEEEISTKQFEPKVQFSHQDYLIAAVQDFRERMIGRTGEKARHTRSKRDINECLLENYEKLRPKSDQEKKALAEEEKKQKAIANTVAIHRKAVAELNQKWKDVYDMETRRRLQEYEDEQQKQGKQALNAMLDYSSQLLVDRRKSQVQQDSREQTETGDSGESEEDEDASGSGSDEDDDDDSDTSSSSDERASRQGSAMGDDELTPEELRRKYAAVADTVDAPPVEAQTPMEADTPIQPDIALTRAIDGEDELSADQPPLDETSHIDTPIPDASNDAPNEPVPTAEVDELLQIDPSTVQLDEVDDMLLDEDEESDSDDDDDDDSDDDDDEDDDDEGSEEEEEEDAGGMSGLMGFLSKKQVKAITTEADETPAESQPAEDAAGDVVMNDAAEKVETAPEPESRAPDEIQAAPAQTTPEPTSTADEQSRQISPATSTAKPSEIDSITSAESDIKTLMTKGHNPTSSSSRIEVPFLLRATLREYQHNGLDWLAGMWRSGTNGILADEMGLGKTIQTISLFAHLAVTEQIWGPHLVIVPTSVMLNWEMEFKKFLPAFKILTYYGTQEERKQKRKGWTDHDRWNVCITSYQLALQDSAALKRKAWHYMVLDEAHNIKNFRSKRWQTLLMFRSEARLLLTGTPLQNNLTELWSLLFFLRPGESEQGGVKFADLATFNKVFHRPVDQIMEGGRETLDDEAKESVAKLHRVLRPHLLRRLKADVEKQMPKKYEHIVKCRLSKRQRQLYDGYMGLAGTRESFQSGNYLSIINCLMQLRKVCNHPDLFETRQIVTSYAMPKSAIADYEIKELLVRKRLVQDDDYIQTDLNLLNLWQDNTSSAPALRAAKLAALGSLAELHQKQKIQLRASSHAGGSTLSAAHSTLELTKRSDRLYQINDQYQRTLRAVTSRPVYSEGLLRKLQVHLKPVNPTRATIIDLFDGMPVGTSTMTSDVLQGMVTTLPQRGEAMTTALQKFGCVTPAVVAPRMVRLALTEQGMETVQEARIELPGDVFHEARTRLSIAFPDKSLIQYDCGKLQALARLLRDLQAKGSRALIFTQMTKVLDILEQFLNLHGHRYLRLDGATRIEQRQILTDRFNNDPRILAFILSSRSGGLGINLTGADTVIFYDLDWNPAMDKQCQDRCHRIGQTRDVHIYRFISEGTIEANILRKSNQKRMLDDVVIQEGDFTTEYFNRIDPRSFLDNDTQADAAVDRIFGGSEVQPEKVLEEAEDQEDRVAAENAQKEYVHVDEEDFEEDKNAPAASADTPRSDAPTPAAAGSQSATPAPVAPINDMPGFNRPVPYRIVERPEEEQSWEHAMLDFAKFDLKDQVIKPPSERSRKRAKKGKDYELTRIRRGR